jgi:hypothetical protein
VTGINNKKVGDSHVGSLAVKMGQGSKLTGSVKAGLSAQMNQGGGYKRPSQASKKLRELMGQ